MPSQATPLAAWPDLLTRMGLPPHALPNLKAARSKSLETIRRIRSIVESYVPLGDDIALAVAGSLGRLESGHASDLDLYFFCRGQEQKDEAKENVNAVREGLRADGNRVSDGPMFQGIWTSADLSDLGAAKEDKDNLTARVLFLTEVRPILNAAVVEQIRRDVLDLRFSEPRRGAGSRSSRCSTPSQSADARTPPRRAVQARDAVECEALKENANAHRSGRYRY